MGWFFKSKYRATLQLAALRAFEAQHNFLRMSRAELVALLGTPNFSSRSYFIGSGYFGSGYYSGYDAYYLSNSGSPSLHMTYNESDQLTHYEVKPEVFNFVACDPKAPLIAESRMLQILPMENKIDLGITVAQLADKLGATGKRHITRANKGGQVWSQITHSWRIDDEAQRFLVITHDANKSNLTDEECANLIVARYLTADCR